MRGIAWGAGLALAASALVWTALGGPGAPASTPAPVIAARSPNVATLTASDTAAGVRGAPFASAGAPGRNDQRALWTARLDHAQAALAAYRESTRYPPGSRPIAEHPDQLQPNDPIAEEHALARPGSNEDGGATLLTTQERIYVQGSESVRFTLAARDREGRSLPLQVQQASARELPAPNVPSRFPVVPVAFVDDGSGADVRAGDGIVSARFTPQAQGFADLAGQIRIEAMLQIRGQPGSTYFDVYYTPEAPAAWQGGVREAVVDGSLDFILKAQVARPGRYVVSARVDDASGRPIALLGFNEELAVGPQEIRLTVFGKLLRDAAPAFPLTLRDIDGFLLHPDTFPDRSLMARRIGAVHVSQSYPLTSFSPAEWSAEIRDRYLTELSRDVTTAREQVDRLGGK
ncbi:MAG: choice-of-anchor X domain-containing protein [Burkholderiaceae bacterium]